MIPNVLADRYASREMRLIFSPEQRIVTERRFWVMVHAPAKNAGIDIPLRAIEAYERVWSSGPGLN